MGIKNLLFPTRNLCYFCRERSLDIEGRICNDCREKLVFVNKEIEIESKYISRTIYCLIYNKYLKELIHNFKFNGKSYLYKPFAEIMMQPILEKGFDKADLIIFIPIHRRKEAIRGYNQSELLAGYISKKLEKPLSQGNLTKTKWTREQNTLDRVERIKNLKESFSLKNANEIYGKRILLIDDIITTGSTFDECAKTLTRSGAKEINCLALTSGRI